MRYHAKLYQSVSVVASDLSDNAYGRYMRTWMQGTGTINMTDESAERMARQLLCTRITCCRSWRARGSGLLLAPPSSGGVV